MNIKGNYRTRILFRFGRGSVLFGAAAVTGLSLFSKHGTWKSSLFASQPQPTRSPSQNPSLYHQWDYNWDRRGAPKHAHEDAPSRKRHIILIRHGQYESSKDTDELRILTEKGRFQATTTGRRLNDLNLPYMRIVASTMSRAQETAHLIHQGILSPTVNLEYDDILEEGAPVDPIPPTENWKPHPCQFFQDSARIESAFRKYFFRADPEQLQDSYEVIVCHANVIRFFVCRALQFPINGWIRISLANCSLTMVTIHPDGLVVVEMMGDHGHIPADNVTYQ